MSQQLVREHDTSLVDQDWVVDAIVGETGHDAVNVLGVADCSLLSVRTEADEGRKVCVEVCAEDAATAGRAVATALLRRRWSGAPGRWRVEVLATESDGSHVLVHEWHVAP